MTRLDVFLQLRSANSLSYFAFLESRLSLTELPLVGLRLETYLLVCNELSQTGLFLLQSQTLLVSSRLTHSELAFHGTRQCLAMSRKAPSSTTTDTSLPYANTVGGSTDTLDSGVNTWTRSLCHLHAARRDSHHLAPVGGRHDSFIERRTQCRWEHRSWNRRWGNKRSSIGSSESRAITMKIAGLTKAAPLVRLNVNASVSKARWSTPTS